MTELSGIYLAYITAEFGQSVGVFFIKGGVIAGGDLGGGVYDGSYSTAQQIAKGRIHFRTTEGGTTITGATSDLPVAYDTDFEFSIPLEDAEYHRVETIAGPVNIKFVKIRDV